MKTILNEQTRQDIATLKTDLKTLRDELNLQVRLGSMELRDEWRRLEPQAQRALRELNDSTLRAARELKSRIEQLRAKLQN